MSDERLKALEENHAEMRDDLAFIKEHLGHIRETLDVLLAMAKIDEERHERHEERADG